MIGRAAVYGGLLLALVLLPLAAFWPGMNGPFLFDDYSNLGVLTRFGEPDSLEDVLTLLGNGIAGPTGRPVSLASFLVNDTGWPSVPAMFKYTNILLHALNGLLLCWIVLLGGRIAGLSECAAFRVALLTAFLWVCHPLFVSTVLYVVQRMAMLATTFALLAILAYLKARPALVAGDSGRALVSLALCFGVFFPLSVLSKENGALLPLLLLVFEGAYLGVVCPPRTAAGTRLLRSVGLVGLVLPTCLLLAYMFWRLPAYAAQAAAGRDFSLLQRLLTEPRIIVEYIQLLWLPRIQTHGLYHDHLAVSTGLFSPWSTFPAIVLLSAAAFCAVRLREKYPLPALAVLFFLAGHVMESTVIPLELFFEHRNYLPAVFLFWPLAFWLTHRLTRLKQLLLCLIVVILVTATYARSSLWGDELRLASVWAAENPASERAQLQAASVFDRHGREADAMRFVEHGLSVHPQSLLLNMAGLNLSCVAGEPEIWLPRVERILVSGTFNTQYVFRSLDMLFDAVNARACAGVTPASLLRLADTIAAHPVLSNQPFVMHRLSHFRGQVHLTQGHGERAYEAFLASTQWSASPEGVLKQVALLASNGHVAGALKLLDHYQNQYVRTGKLRAAGVDQLRTDYFMKEMVRMRLQLEKELMRASS